MSQYITVSRSDKAFKDYMLGVVPGKDNLRSVPVKGFNDIGFKDKVTFQLIEKSCLSYKEIPSLLFRLFRVKWLTLTLSPVICTLTYLNSQGFELDTVASIVIVFCVFFSHACVFLLNDFYDHMFGVDTLSSNAGTRIIQQAWLTALQVRYIGLVLSVFCVVSGVYLSYIYGWQLLLLGGVGLTMSWLYSYLSRYKRFLGLNGFLINMFMGPFLVLGVSWGIFRYFNISLIILGLFFGLLAYICICYRHLENLFYSQKRVGTSLVDYLGFDKAKIFIMGLVLLLPFVYVTLVLSLSLGRLSTNLFVLSLPLVFYIYFLNKNMRLKTSMGSSITFLRDYTAGLHFLSGISLVIYFLL